MKELILRISTLNDVEILKNENGKLLFKKTEKEIVLKKIAAYLNQIDLGFVKPRVFSKNIYAMSTGMQVILQKESKRIVVYKNKSYSISFPNSIYFISYSKNRIEKIKAFSYKVFRGQETVLYEYPMPNMLTCDEICLGTANRRITENVEKTLDIIIETEFTHSVVNGVKGFKDTDNYFRYLSKNPFPYDMLIKTNLKVGDLVDE